MRLATVAPLAIVVLLLQSCTPLVPVTTPADTDAATNVKCDLADWLPFDTPGTGTLEGQAFLRTRGGEVRVGAGSPVLLVPAVACVGYWYRLAGSIWATRDYFPADASFNAHIRRTIADAEGRFKFSGLPAGAYLIRSQVVWEVPDTNVFTNDLQGGIVGGEFAVKEGEATTAMLTWQ